ncbi:M48 family metalloprotease [Methylomonas sp. AM2-LC]|uniref:M48 family metalloprotease n=1 Tax=Methylomonas sp. AM2-LC TaxID=3153301 RepID=UPI0032659AE4
MKIKSLALSIALILVSTSKQAVEIEKIQLPDMGDSSGAIISPAQEKELGESFFRGLHSETTINQDMEIQQFIQTIGQQLVAHSYAPANPFHFFVVMDPNINAFAGPGGYIGVNSGLILLTESESELASVMAHEIAHVTQRHLYRSIEQSERMSIPTIAATLASALLAIKAPSAGMAGLMAVQAGNVQFQINFTRDHEKEADRVGMNTLFDSNFDPRSMPIFFERLQQATRFYGSGVPEFLRTHPMSENRVADTRGRAETYPYRQYPDSIGYALTKAKLAVIAETDKKVALQHFAVLELQGTVEQRAVAHYGIGLAYLDMQQFEAASSVFSKLTEQYPTQPQYISALARTEVESHNFDKANQLFAKAINTFPSNDAIKIDYIRSLLKSSHPQQALIILDTLSGTEKRQPIYFELLAQTYADLHQPGESHRYLAEYYYASGATEDAIMQIRLARDEKDLNYQLLAILNERLSFFQAEQEDRKAKRK